MRKEARTKLRRLNELVSSQNAQVDKSIDRLVNNVTENEPADQPRSDSTEIQKTTQLLLMNSLIMGESDNA